MLKINQSTQKKELLNWLANLANTSGDLIVDIQSLPNFLATPIAFTIFNYQISNYPRSIVWTSKHPSIVKFLSDCQVEYIDPASEPNSQATVVESSTQIPRTNIKEVVKEESIEKTPEVKSKPFSGFTPASKAKTSIENSGPVNQIKASQPPSVQVEETAVNQPSPIATEKQASAEPKIAFTKAGKLSVDRLLGADTYRPSLLLESTNANIQQSQLKSANSKPIFSVEAKPKEAQPETEQNLDNWLERINATRQALDSNKAKVFATPSPWRVKVWQFVSVAAILSLLILSLVSVFPTQIYSVEVKALEKPGSKSIDISMSDLKANEYDLEAKVTTTPTGIEQRTLNNARGFVLVENLSGSAVSFNKEGIILQSSSGREFRHLGKSNEPGTFSIPARSNLNGGNQTIEIEAQTAGQGGILAKGEKLKILNLKRDSIGSLLTATVIEGVDLTAETGNKIVQDSDRQALQEKANQDIGSLVGEKVNLLSENELLITDSKWFETDVVNYQFSSGVGQVAPEISLVASTKAKIYTLSLDNLKARLLEITPEATSVLEVTEIQKLAGLPSANNPTSLQVEYTFQEKLDFSQDEIVKIVSENNTQQAKEKLKETYPNVLDLQRRESGFDLPGVKPIISIEINETKN